MSSRATLNLLAFSSLVFSTGLSCKTGEETNSEEKVIGGRTDGQALPKTIRIDFDKGMCTGVFISDSLLLTAAHCFWNQTFVKIRAESSVFSKTPPSSEWIIHPKWFTRDTSIPGVLPKDSQWDVALVRFPPGTAPKSMIAPLATVAPKEGDPIKFVGYGRTKLDRQGPNTSGIRHYGENTIEKIESEWGHSIVSIGVDGSLPLAKGPMDSSIGSGDSGGPLYNAKDEVIGVTSTSGHTEDKLQAFSRWANVTSPATREFIDSILAKKPTEPLTPAAPPSP